MSSLSVYLPEEILVKILRKLPSKSLLRFTSVCNSWLSLINDPSFIFVHHRHHHRQHHRQHRRRNSSTTSLLQLFKELSSCNSNPLPILYNSNLFLTSLSIPSSLFLPFSGDLFDICHGLHCLSIDESCSSLIICNPFIRRFLIVPEFLKPLNSYPLFAANIFALGFDSRNCDYKIIRITMEDKDNGFVPWVDVFSLASGSWRHLTHDVAPILWFGQDTHAFVNGLAHWGAQRRVQEVQYHLFVLSFDFKDEVFHEIALPESLARTSLIEASVEVVKSGDMKTLIVHHYQNRLPFIGSIWVMKEYDDVESWNKVFLYGISNEWGFEIPYFDIKITSVKDILIDSCVTKNEETFLVIKLYIKERKKRKECFYLVDVERERFLELPIEQDFSWCLDGCVADTLVLLNKDGAQSY